MIGRAVLIVLLSDIRRRNSPNDFVVVLVRDSDTPATSNVRGLVAVAFVRGSESPFAKTIGDGLECDSGCRP